MEITVTGKNIEITEAIKEYASDKVAKLPRYYDRVSGIDMIAGKADHSGGFEVEVIVKAERADPFIATSTGTDLYACIDETVDKLERQLTDHKGKLRNRKHNVN